jgi:hypothetical protein
MRETHDKVSKHWHLDFGGWGFIGGRGPWWPADRAFQKALITSLQGGDRAEYGLDEILLETTLLRRSRRLLRFHMVGHLICA